MIQSINLLIAEAIDKCAARIGPFFYALFYVLRHTGMIAGVILIAFAFSALSESIAEYDNAEKKKSSSARASRLMVLGIFVALLPYILAIIVAQVL